MVPGLTIPMGFQAVIPNHEVVDLSYYNGEVKQPQPFNSNVRGDILAQE